MTELVYSVKNHILRQSIIKDGQMEGEGCVVSDESESGLQIFLRAFDGIEEGTDWGRFSFEYEGEEGLTLAVYAMAGDDLIQPDNIRMFQGEDVIHVIGHNDVLLYSLKGRYLYIAVRVVGTGKAKVSSMRVDKLGDTFMNTFPEVYRERNSFFHRYMSVFSSIYNDFQEKIDHLPDNLDLDTCPVNLLPMYGKWMGIDIDCDFRDETIMRNFVKEAYMLNRLKGTKKALSRVVEIITGEKPIIIEKNIIDEFLDEEYKESYETLFGNNVYNVCVLLNSSISEVTKSQLIYMMNQYLPIRARVQITNLEQEGDLDNHSYLDINAKLFATSTGELDENMRMDESITLL